MSLLMHIIILANKIVMFNLFLTNIMVSHVSRFNLYMFSPRRFTIWFGNW